HLHAAAARLPERELDHARRRRPPRRAGRHDLLMTIRAEHVGSLLRPPELLAARAAGDPGLRALEERAIRDAIALQRSAGFDVVTDGEFRRDTWLGYWWESTDGLVELDELPFEIEWHELDEKLRQEELQLDPVAIGGKLSRRTPSLPEVEADFLLREAGGPF